MKNSLNRVAVVGAGPAGLVCAYELQKAGLDVTVFEKNAQVGGRMSTRRQCGLPFDVGANFLVKNYATVHAYCEELGIPGVWQAMEPGQIMAFKGVKPHEVTSVPWRLMWKNHHISRRARVAMVRWFVEETAKAQHLDFYNLSTAAAQDTGNAYAYVEQHAGKEVADYVVDSFVAAYQFHGARELSVGMMLALVELMVRDNDGFTMHHTQGGMDVLPNALAARLKTHVGVACSSVTAGPAGVTIQVGPVSHTFDAVVLASTANATAKMYRNPTPAQAAMLESVEYACTVNASFLVPKAPLKDLALVMVPHAESVIISEYTDESMKGPGLVKDGMTLINAGLHAAFADTVIHLPDAELFELIRQELIRVCPALQGHEARVHNADLERWDAAMPKFRPGYLASTAAFLEQGQGGNNVFLCGDYLNSPWIEGSMQCGRRVASQVLATRQ